MTFGEQGTITYLPKIAKILRSDRSIDEKFKAVQKTGLPSVGPDSFRSLVTDFSASEQLEHRLEQLIRLQDRLPKEAATESQPSTPHL